tara:strand:- start:53 stop:535 length:483 start_codon:yes stop_codon:yes gene_type:complete
MDIFGQFARTWNDQGLGFGQHSYNAARSAGYTNLQIQQGLVGRRVGDLAQRMIAAGVQQEYDAQRRAQQQQYQQLTAQFQQQMAAQQAQIAEQNEKYQAAQEQYGKDMARMQQQSLEAQTRQAAKQQTVQVAKPSKSLVIRSGARSKFNRPELQIKSMNI